MPQLALEGLDAPRERAQRQEVTYQGLRILLDRPQGTVREVTGPDGNKVAVTQKDDYGFFAPKKTGEQPMGEDGQPYDAYVGKVPAEPRVRIITQLSAHNGARRQQKAMLGYGTDDDAKTAFLAHSHPRMFGRLGSLTLEAFKAQMSAAVETGRVLIVETDEDDAEFATMRDLAVETELDHLLGMGASKAAGITNFPCEGEDKAVSLRNSAHPRCSIDIGDALQADCPDLWATGGTGAQHAILARVARTGGAAKTRAEVAAVRMREAWAAKHASASDTRTVVQQSMWLVQHTKGEEHMKQVLAEAKTGLLKSDEEPEEPEPASDVEPSVEPASSVSSSDLTADARAADHADRTTPQAAVPIDHRSEDAADPGPLSRIPAQITTQRTPMPQEHAHARSFDQLLQRAALCALLDGDWTGPGLSSRDAGAADGVPRSAPAAGGVSRAGGAAVPGSDAPGPEVRRELSVQIKADTIDREKREVWWIASTTTIDSYNEIVDQKEWDFSRFKKNPVILFCHESRSLPIGKGVDWKVEADQLLIKVRFSKANPMAEVIWQMVLEDMIRAGSVGFMPGEITYVEIDGKQRVVLKKNRLFEFSICAIPANPDAVMLGAFEERLSRALDAFEQRLRAMQSAPPHPPSGGPTPPPPAVGPSNQPRAAVTVLPRASSKGIPDMKILTLDPKLQNTLRDTGHITFTCSCGDEHRIEAPVLSRALSEAAAAKTAAEERAAAADAQKASVIVERDAAVKLAADHLAALTKLELGPLVGLEVYQLTAAEAEGLATVRLSAPEQYKSLLASAKERYAKGHAAAQAEAERKAKEGPAPAPKVDASAPAERTPPTHAPDATPPATKESLGATDADTVLGRINKAAAQTLAASPAS